MRVTRLTVAGLRNLRGTDMRPGPGFNLLVGDNGAGKTSVLEALHLMAYGRSFRGRVRDGLVRRDAGVLDVFVEWQEEASGRTRRAGLRHGGQDWSGRLDGEDVAQLGDLCAALSVVSFEPGSHALMTGAADGRRRYLDWGLFHVEQDFLAVWRRYGRALRQRNALLKARAAGAELDAWEHELDAAGTLLTARREGYLRELSPQVAGMAQDLLPGGGGASLRFLPGWRREELPLADALLLARERDLAAGFTSVGPHRADWRLDLESIPGREALSRGQAKLAALSMLLAQAAHQAGRRGEWPVIALDDLASELDRRHQAGVLQRLAGTGAQVFVTGTEPIALPPGLEAVMFHVEHGDVQAMPAAQGGPPPPG